MAIQPKSTHSVEIPEWALLTIATHGNMGDGELPHVMQIWAEKECKRLGLQEKLSKEKQERYEELKQRVRNVWGSEVIDKIEGITEKITKALPQNR